MKKFLSLVVCVCFIVSALSACSSPGDVTDTLTHTYETGSAEEPAKTAAPALKPRKIPTVPSPYTASDLAKIPVANSSMTEYELREIVIAFMRDQNSLQWTPAENYDYYLPSCSASDPSGYMHIYRGRVYLGLPYNGASSSIYTFLDYIDPETGILSIDENTAFDKFGNDCADAVFWSWARVSSSISFKETRYMNLKNGCVPVGTYVFPDNVTDYKSYSTKKICNDNGRQTMYESYAAMKPGDGLVTFVDPAGHAMLFVQNYVTRKADGTIDGTNSYILFIDQSSDVNKISLADGVTGYDIATVENGVRNKMNYDTLFTQSFIPLTIPEFSDPSKVEEAKVSLDTDKTDLTVKELSKQALVSNYRISKVTFSILDKNGTEVYTKSAYATDSSMYKFTFTTMLGRWSDSNYKFTGGESIVIKALVSTGVTFEAYRSAVPVS